MTDRNGGLDAAISVNARAGALVQALRADAQALRVGVSTGTLGETRIDAGGRFAGGIAAGLRLAEITMGGLGQVALVATTDFPRWPWSVLVRSSLPVTACLASQYAGWHLRHADAPDAYEALGSGPARALARREPFFAELGYADDAQDGILVCESAAPPPAPVVAEVAGACGIEPGRMTFLHAPVTSLAGGCQVAARTLEVALHKLHKLGFPLERVLDGVGCAPLPPPHPDPAVAMGRTNDAIIYAGRVQLFVSGPAQDAKALADALPSRTSRDYGHPFAETFRRSGGDFYAIDPMLFSPAEAIVTALDAGETFRAGRFAPAILDASFDG